MKSKWFLRIIILLIILLLIEFIPMLRLKTMKMVEYQSNHFIFYYEEQDYEVMLELKDELEHKYEYINRSIDFSTDSKTRVFVYPNQRSLQVRKYGTIVLLFNLEWYIGDNIKDQILIVSPNQNIKNHTKESIIGAVAHEYVHTIMYRLNPDVSLWINEGMALYLTNGEELKSIQFYNHIPTFKETKTNSPVAFANSNGYQFAHIYIAYLVKEYGMEKVLLLIETNNYDDTLGLSQDEIYHQWIQYLQETYP